MILLLSKFDEALDDAVIDRDSIQRPGLKGVYKNMPAFITS